MFLPFQLKNYQKQGTNKYIINLFFLKIPCLSYGMQATYCHVSEIWWEYVGYDFDLDLPSVLSAPDLVSNGNIYTDLVDGNRATCVDTDSTA